MANLLQKIIRPSAIDGAVQEAAGSEVHMNDKLTREEELVKIYNNAIEVLEGDGSYYWDLGEAKKYALGYVDALQANNFINHKEAWNMYNELLDVIIEIHERETK